LNKFSTIDNILDNNNNKNNNNNNFEIDFNKKTIDDNKSKFALSKSLSPKGDQPQAINSLVEGIKANKKKQILLGVTGSGKTFTIANVISKINKNVLVYHTIKLLQHSYILNLKSFFPIIT